MRNKEEYEWLKAHKICVTCRSDTATRGTQCDLCADKDLERKEKRLAAMTLEEKQALREKNKEYLRKRYAERKEKGLCYVCGKPVYKNHSRCYECYLQEKRKDRIRQERKKKNYMEIGKCRICGKEVVKGKKLCQEHLEQARERMRYAAQFIRR